jgi:hypothetical protein
MSHHGIRVDEVMNSQKSENVPINSQPNRRLHRNDLPAIIFIASLLVILIVLGLWFVMGRENFLELQIGDVVNYKKLLDDFAPRDNLIVPSWLFEGLLFTSLISFTVGWVVGSRRSIIVVRVVFVSCLVSCGLLLILLNHTVDSSFYNSDELRHLAHSEYEGKIYNLAEESVFDGIRFAQYDNYWLFECDNAESRCVVMYIQPGSWFLEGPTELVHDISNNSLVMMVQGEIVYTIPAEDQ